MRREFGTGLESACDRFGIKLVLGSLRDALEFTRRYHMYVSFAVSTMWFAAFNGHRMANAPDHSPHHIHSHELVG